MAYFTCNFTSSALLHEAAFDIYLPTEKSILDAASDYTEYYKLKQNFKTLYLLHGAIDNNKSWLYYSNIIQYAREHSLAVVFPSAENSFYIDNSVYGKYFTYIADELVAYTRSIFPLSLNREDTYIGGLSMGGYGAVELAFKRPETFSKAFSLSGALDITMAARHMRNFGMEAEKIIGNIKTLKGSEIDLSTIFLHLIKSLSHRPELFIACGTEDFLYPDNLKFVNMLKQFNYPVKYIESPGDHNWDFWNSYLKEAVDWLLD